MPADVKDAEAEASAEAAADLEEMIRLIVRQEIGVMLQQGSIQRGPGQR